MQRVRRSHTRRAPFICAEVEAGATYRGFDAQRKTGGGGRPALMASQQVKKAAELQDPEVRAELNRRVRECKRKYFASVRLDSIQQARAYTRQKAIFHPRQLLPANSFVIHEVSSSSSFSLRRSYRHGTSLSVRSFPQPRSALIL
jgi:hypothetical protein